MNRKTVSILTAVACTLAVAAGSARAHGDGPSRIVFVVANVGEASCSDALFGLSFDMVSPAGVRLGSGTACVHSVEGCQFAGCRSTLRTTFTLNFRRGSLTGPVKLRELWTTDSSLNQRARGKITGGTGDFANASGRIKGAGSVDFAAGIVDLVYVVRLKGGSDDDDDD